MNVVDNLLHIANSEAGSGSRDWLRRGHHLVESAVCRNLPAVVREAQPDVSSEDGLEIKVCLRTYRLFYVSNTEDFMWRHRYKEEVDKNSQRLKLRNELRRKWLAAS